MKDVPIKYHNQTGDIDFDVMVFAKNNLKNFPSDKQIAWKILRGQKSVKFFYPSQLQVGARYFPDGQVVRCGPKNAGLGTTWEIVQERPTDTPIFRQGNKLKTDEGMPVQRFSILAFSTEY